MHIAGKFGSQNILQNAPQQVFGDFKFGELKQLTATPLVVCSIYITCCYTCQIEAKYGSMFLVSMAFLEGLLSN